MYATGFPNRAAFAAISSRTITCPPPDLCAAKAGQSIGESGQGFTVKVATYAAPTSVCQDGCTALNDSVGIFSSKAGQKYFNGFDASLAVYNGTACSPAEVAAPEGPPAPCPTGQCPGTVNGTPVCVPCDENVTVKKTVSSKTNGDGTTTWTERTETTTCTGASCTVKVEIEVRTVPTVNGPPDFEVPDPDAETGEETEEQEPSDFCKDNPTSPLCKSSSFGGSCGGFTCDGDAVQCAMAREQHNRNCALFDTETALAQLGADAADGNPTPPGHPGAPGEETALSLDFNTVIDRTPLIASNCPPDMTVSVAGTSGVIEFSAMCEPLGWMGKIVLAFTALACLFIVFGKKD